MRRNPLVRSVGLAVIQAALSVQHAVGVRLYRLAQRAAPASPPAADSADPAAGLTIAIAAIFKNEAPYLLEWLAFHRVVGVDRFVIADDGSTDGTSSLLGRLAAAGYLTYVPVHRSPHAPPQLAVYAELWRRYPDLAEWIGFIDSDEFAMPTDGALSIRPVFAKLRSNPRIGSISPNWCNYGSSGLLESDGRPVLARFGWRTRPDWPINHHLKTFVRASAYQRVYANPHIFVLKPGTRPVHTDGQPVFEHPRLRKGLSADIIWSGFRLNHYMIKSRAEFLTKAAKTSVDRATQPRNLEYFANNDRNDVLDPAPAALVDLTLAEMARITARLAANGDATRAEPPIILT